MTSNVLM